MRSGDAFHNGNLKRKVYLLTLTIKGLPRDLWAVAETIWLLTGTRVCMSVAQRCGECLAVFPAFGLRQIAIKTVAKAGEGSAIDIGMDAAGVGVEKLRMPLQIGSGERLDRVCRLDGHDRPEFVGRRRGSARVRRLVGRGRIVGFLGDR